MAFLFGRKQSKPTLTELSAPTDFVSISPTIVEPEQIEEKSVGLQTILTRLEAIETQNKHLLKQLGEQTKMIDRLVESNRLLISWHRTTAESDARKMNLSVRSFYTGSPATKFMASSTTDSTTMF